MSLSDFNLHPNVLKALDRIGYLHPALSVAASLPAILSGSDVLADARPGTGEMAALTIPALNYVVGKPAETAQVVILTPDLERAVRIEQDLSELDGEAAACCVVYGVAGLGKVNKAAQNDFRILISTPDRLIAHFGRYYMKLDGVHLLLVDRVGEMLKANLRSALEQVIGQLPAERQIVMFGDRSSDVVAELGNALLTDPIMPQSETDADKRTSAIQTTWPVATHLRTRLVERLAEKFRFHRTVVLVNESRAVHPIVRKLRARNRRAVALLANQPDDQKQSIIRGLKSQKHPIVVTTADLLSLFETGNVRNVVGYDLPAAPDIYLSYLEQAPNAHFFWLITPEESAGLKSMEAAMGRPLDRETLAKFDYDMPAPYDRNKPRPTPMELPLVEWGDRNAPRRDPLKIPLEDWTPDPLPAVWTEPSSAEQRAKMKSSGNKRRGGQHKSGSRRRRNRRKPGSGNNVPAEKKNSRRRGKRNFGSQS